MGKIAFMVKTKKSRRLLREKEEHTKEKGMTGKRYLSKYRVSFTVWIPSIAYNGFKNKLTTLGFKDIKLEFVRNDSTVKSTLPSTGMCPMGDKFEKYPKCNKRSCPHYDYYGCKHPEGK